jgi:hypothetical protein
MISNRHSRRSARKDFRAVNALHPASRSRALVIVLALVALAIQIFVVQSHIHIPQAAGRLQSISLIDLVSGTQTGAHQGAGVPHDKYPVDEDPSNCPLCQELAHSGQFVQSVAALVALPVSVTVHFIVFNEVAPTLFAVSHSWRGRAPPEA